MSETPVFKSFTIWLNLGQLFQQQKKTTCEASLAISLVTIYCSKQHLSKEKAVKTGLSLPNPIPRNKRIM